MLETVDENLVGAKWEDILQSLFMWCDQAKDIDIRWQKYNILNVHQNQGHARWNVSKLTLLVSISISGFTFSVYGLEFLCKFHATTVPSPV